MKIKPSILLEDQKLRFLMKYRKKLLTSRVSLDLCHNKVPGVPDQALKCNEKNPNFPNVAFNFFSIELKIVLQYSSKFIILKCGCVLCLHFAFPLSSPPGFM